MGIHHLRSSWSFVQARPALILGVAVLLIASMPIRGLAAPFGQVHVSAHVADKAARHESVEALILLDDSDEQAAQRAADLRRPALHRAGKAEYAQRMNERKGRLDGLKARVTPDLIGSDLELLHDYSAMPILHVRLASAAALDRIARHAKVLSVDENTPNKPFLSQSLPLINQPQAASQGHQGAGATVAILDTGVDYTRTAFGSCSAPGGSCKVVYAADFAPNDGSLDDNGHGTNVAGIALGVAAEAKVAALDVFRTDGFAYTSDIISANNWCITNKAAYNIAAISMSLGSGRYYSPITTMDSWHTAIQNAVNAGIVVVAASGNEAYKDSISSPAAYSNVVSVGAVYDANVGRMSWSSGCTDNTTKADKVTCFSNSASFLTLLAPGAIITAAGISMGGTSQATPHVAGAVAALRADDPIASVATLTERLQIGPLIADTNSIAKPRLDLVQALNSIPATAPQAPTAVTATAGDGQATVSFTAPASDGGSPITGYTVTANPAGGADSHAGTTATTHTVANLTNGTTYTFTVVATNSVGSSPSSSPSNSVTPKAEQSITVQTPAPATAPYGAQFTVSATAPGGPVTYSSGTPAICTNVGPTFTMVGASGVCTVWYDQAGSVSYRPAPQVGNSTQAVKATAIVTLSDLSQDYDSTPKSVTATTTPPGLTVSLTYDGAAPVPTAAGSYAVDALVNDLHYDGSAGGTLIINKRSLTISADNQSRPYYTFNQALTWQAGGFVAGESDTVLSGAPLVSTPAQQDSPVGTYPITITAGSLAAANYSFTFVPGVLTIYGTVPGPPTMVTAVAGGDGQVDVSFVPPASDGGTPITGYTVVSNPGGGVDGNAGSTVTTHTVTGLSNGATYTFTVTATNALGTGPPSAASNPVAPLSTGDLDGDGVTNGLDAFPADAAEWQDRDNDGIGDNHDNCPSVANTGQEDQDGDVVGDACDGAPTAANYGSVVDAPHDEYHGVSCADCHSYTLWWQYSPARAGFAPSYGAIAGAVCAKCHSGISTHGTLAVDGFTTNCIDCHSPHDQAQVEWRGSVNADELYLRRGTITGNFAVDGGQTTFSYALETSGGGNPEWSTPMVWGSKTGSLPPRGLILVVDTANAIASYRVIGATDATITVKGGINPDAVNRSFGLIYGQMIKKRIATPTEGTREVRFFDPKAESGGYTDGNSPPSGICQVCHADAALSWNSSGSGSNPGHDPGLHCSDCHTMSQGFKP